MKPPVSRRTALKSLGAAAGAVTALPWLSDDGVQAFAGLQRAAAAPALKVLTPTQYAAVGALVDGLIPADDRSPGAREARVADYIDLLLSEVEPEIRQRWLDGLAVMDTEATTRLGASVDKLSAAQIEMLLTAVSANERQPQTDAERFFVMAKAVTIQGYYTSEIGIHKELRYKGNQFLPEFHGCQTVDGKDCPYCGQKAAV